jgi:PAS domain S-box-containing protein
VIDYQALVLALACLAFYILADVIRPSRQLWPGYAGVALFASWLLLGPLAAVGITLLGLVLALVVRRLVHLPPVALGPYVLIPSASLAAAIFSLILLRGYVPLSNLDVLTLIPVALALVIGWGTAWLLSFYQQSPPRVMPALRQLVVEGLSLALLLLLAPSTPQHGPVVILALIGILAWQAYYARHVDAAQQDLERRTRELDLLSNVSQFTAHNLDLDTLLWKIYQHTAQVVQASVFVIALYDDESDRLEYRLVVADGVKINWPVRPLTEGATAYVIRKRQPLHVTARNRHRYPELQDYTPTMSYLDYLGVPLLVEGKVLGVLAVMSSESAGTFGKREIDVMQAVANQTGLAVRNAMLYTRQSEWVQRLSQLNDAVPQMLFDNNRNSALATACQLTAQLSGAGRVAFFLKDSAGYKLEASVGLTPEQCQPLRAHPPEIPEAACVIANAPLEHLTDFPSRLELPLRVGQAALGLLVIYDHRPHFFRSRDLDLLAILANQIIAMLENIRLFEVMESNAYEMSQLVQLSRISTSSLEIEEVVHNIADMLQQMAGVSRVAIMTLEPNRARLLAMVNSRHESAPAPAAYLPLFPELTALMHMETPATQVHQITDAHLSALMQAQMTDYQESTAALVPLVVEDEVVGAVLLGSHALRRFAAREWQFIELAANQIAAQINNIRLYEKSQHDLNQRLDQLALVEDIAQQVSSSLDFSQIINHVLEAALKAAGADLVSLGLLTDADQFWVIEQQADQEESGRRYGTQSTDQGLMGEVLRINAPVLLADNRSAPYYASDYPDTYRSALGVPLCKDAGAIGVLVVESQRVNAFHPEQAGFLTRLAGHAVTSIENARFLEARQQEIELLKSLRELALWLVSAGDTRSAGHEILETALQLFQGQNAVLYAYDAANQHLSPLAILWFSADPDAQADEVLPLQIAQQAAHTGELVFVPDVQQVAGVAALADIHYHSVVAVPLKRAQQVYYVILMTFDDYHELIERDYNALDLLAGQAVGHLENASLHERIRTARDQMRAILNSTQDGMILLDRDARLIEINPSAQSLLGIPLDRHLGQRFPDVLTRYEHEPLQGYTTQDITELLQILRSDADQETRRKLQRHVDHQTIHIEEIGLPVHDEDQQISGRLLVLRDVSEAQRLEEQREDLTDMLVHDLRGPLGSIRNAVDLVLAGLDDPQMLEESAVLLRASRKNTVRLLNLVETLLDIARMQSPDMVLDLEPVTVSALMDTTLTALATPIQEVQIRIHCDLSDDLPLVRVDIEKIERVFINLLDNALRYTPEHGEILLQAQVKAPGKWVEICINDSGPGIPPERRDEVFERFRRIPGQSPQRGHKGHGLGLNFTRQAIEKHGGTIQVVDGPLPGACFIFSLPITE